MTTAVYKTLRLQSDILWHLLIRHGSLYSSVITTLIYYDKIFSPFRDVLTEFDLLVY